MKYTKETISLLKTGAPMMTFGIMLEHYLSALDEIERLRSENEWIPVSKKVPEDDGDYLTLWRNKKTGGIGMQVVYFSTMLHWADSEAEEIGCEITHWRPIPTPPEAE